MRQVYRLRRDHYAPGGTMESEVLRATFTSFASVREHCDEMQRQYDYECQPVTVWVLDQDDVPIYRVSGFDPPEQQERPGHSRKPEPRVGRIA